MSELHEPLYVTYEQAERLTSLGRTKLREIVDSGEVRAARVGRAVRLERSSLLAYMGRSSKGGDPRLNRYEDA